MNDSLISINPTTGKELSRYKMHTDKQIETALQNSVKTFNEWRLLSFAQRAKILKSIAREIRKEKDNLVRLATMEMGKPIQQRVCTDGD